MKATCDDFEVGDAVIAAGHFCRVLGRDGPALMLAPKGEPFYILEDPAFTEHLCKCRAKRFRGARSSVILSDGWIHAVPRCSVIGQA